MQRQQDECARRLRQPPFGWSRSKIDEQQREYIEDRAAILEMCKRVTRIQWQSVNCLDQEVSEKLRANLLHALACVARSMTKNEEEIM